jgi:hypothetical protein
MGLLGKGAMVIWHDIVADGDADFNEWHSKEHMLERVGVPGFRRGQRGRALSGAPDYVNLYEVDDLAVLTSAPYLERLNNPTPWTQRSLPSFRNTNRTLCRVVASVGAGICGDLLTIQLAADRPEALGRWLCATMPAVAERQGVIGAHYLEGDEAASRTETQEKRLRAGSDAIADRVILIAGYAPEALEEVRRTVLAPAALVAQGAAATQQAAIYRLSHCVTEDDLAP